MEAEKERFQVQEVVDRIAEEDAVEAATRTDNSSTTGPKPKDSLTNINIILSAWAIYI